MKCEKFHFELLQQLRAFLDQINSAIATFQNQEVKVPHSLGNKIKTFVKIQ